MLALYQVVLACDIDQLGDDFVKRNDERRATYAKAGVGDLVQLYILNARPAIGLDVLIVDTDHLHLSLTTSTGDSHFQSGIVFENQPNLASVFVDWFERVVLPDAEPYEQFKPELLKRLGSQHRN